MNGTIRYTVRPYDTFWMLAQVFNTTADSIMELNPGVDPRNLQVGHVITIRPGFQYYPPYPIDNNMMGNNNMLRRPNNSMMNGTMPNSGMMSGNMPNSGMMNGTMPNSGMMNGGMMDSGMMNGGMMDDMMDDCGILPDLTDLFRMLWGEHIMWTRMVMLGIIFDLPELEFSTQRLLRNATDMANALGTFYGNEVAKTFENLFRQHITIAAELVNAAKAGDTNQVDAIWQRWADNANQIAELLGSINPNWSAEDWSAMMMEHLVLLGDNISNFLEQNYQEAVDGFDDIVIQAMEMADMMAEGIALQFPG
ncbi:MAG: LysM peptidoglycan-binding domain-containing protein [Clostridiales bacterium]|nr:LysM peptidoglycan-binding domain-containing protein [Clostridiales bacterium]